MVDEVVENHGSFSVEFRGVTLSPEAVLIQGFPQSDALARLRTLPFAGAPGGGASLPRAHPPDIQTRFALASGLGV